MTAEKALTIIACDLAYHIQAQFGLTEAHRHSIAMHLQGRQSQLERELDWDTLVVERVMQLKQAILALEGGDTVEEDCGGEGHTC